MRHRNATLTAPRDRHSLSEAIRQFLIDEFESGRLGPGSQLPTEKQLAERFGVSLAPVRSALGELDNVGRIERIPGRGTFVRHPPVSVEISFMPSISQTMRKAGLDFAMVLIERTLIEADGDLIKTLSLGRARQVVWIRRALAIAGARVALVDSWLPARRFRGLLSDRDLSLGGSLYARLHDVFGVSANSSGGVLSVVPADDAVGRLIDSAFGSALIRVTTTAHDQDGMPIEYSVVHYDANRFVFNLHAPSNAGHGVAAP